MDFYKKYGSSESRREELIRKIEAAVNNLTLEELEALHYDMITKNYKNRAICYRSMAREEQEEGKKAELIAKAEADEENAKELNIHI